jgi:hypothetical protein
VTRAILRERVSRQQADKTEPARTTDFVLTHPALLQEGGYFFNAFVNSHFGIIDRTMVVAIHQGSSRAAQ